jgi:hypothetical protein
MNVGARGVGETGESCLHLTVGDKIGTPTSRGLDAVSPGPTVALRLPTTLIAQDFGGGRSAQVSRNGLRPDS